MNAKLHISPQSEENFLPTQTLDSCFVFKEQKQIYLMYHPLDIYTQKTIQLCYKSGSCNSNNYRSGKLTYVASQSGKQCLDQDFFVNIVVWNHGITSIINSILPTFEGKIQVLTYMIGRTSPCCKSQLKQPHQQRHFYYPFPEVQVNMQV